MLLEFFLDSLSRFNTLSIGFLVSLYIRPWILLLPNLLRLDSVGRIVNACCGGRRFFRRGIIVFRDTFHDLGIVIGIEGFSLLVLRIQ